jgi:peptidoglycan/LPS O-acetylase OafA/YrhL
MSNILYRPDIDGLRAVAVLSVVIFHFNNNWLPGGFIGVDIFFVISGYLITGNIYKSIQSNTFSFADFYARRIKRIIPAATVVILVTLIFGHFILIPDDLMDLSVSALASQLSLANIYFTYFFSSGYFTPDAKMQPLLHFWSLGVEEQFYMFWPIVLMFLSLKLSYKNLLLATFALAIVSFIVAQITLISNPMFSYYMLPSRAGQLLVGAICFLLFLRINQNPTTDSNLVYFYKIAAWIGVIGIFISLKYLRQDASYPGVNSLIPTVSSGLVLLFSPYGVLKNLLSIKPIVFIGLVSYSMYLWHWPLLVYSKYIFSDIDWYWFFPYFIFLILLSFLSWKYIEQVFRKKTGSFKLIFTKQYVFPSLLVIVICMFYIGTKGLGFYSGNNINVITKVNVIPQPAHRDTRVCQEFLISEELLNEPRCSINSSSASEILLWGDSNAAHFVPLLAEVAFEKNFSFRNIAHASCPPLLFGAEYLIPENRKADCLASIEIVKNSLDDYPIAFLSAAWGFYFNNNPDMFKRQFEKTLTYLVENGQKVIVIGRITAFPSLDTKCIHKQIKVPFVNCDATKKIYAGVDELSARVNQYLQDASNGYANVFYIDFNELICDINGCSAFIDDNLVYMDSTHLSAQGSRILGKKALSNSSFMNSLNDLNIY